MEPEKKGKLCPLLTAGALACGEGVALVDAGCLEERCAWWALEACAVPLSLIRLPQKTFPDSMKALLLEQADLLTTQAGLLAAHEARFSKLEGKLARQFCDDRWEDDRS